MSLEKKTAVDTAENKVPDITSANWKTKHNQQKFYDPITFKGIKIGYTGDLMDDENVPF